MKLKRIHADLDINHAKWRAYRGEVKRMIDGSDPEDYSSSSKTNSSAKLVIADNGNLELKLLGEHQIDHNLRLGFFQRIRMRRAVRKWRARLTDDLFAKLGKREKANAENK